LSTSNLNLEIYCRRLSNLFLILKNFLSEAFKPTNFCNEPSPLSFTLTSILSQLFDIQRNLVKNVDCASNVHLLHLNLVSFHPVSAKCRTRKFGLSRFQLFLMWSVTSKNSLCQKSCIITYLQLGMQTKH
jgi:hypothetical protein